MESLQDMHAYLSTDIYSSYTRILLKEAPSILIIPVTSHKTIITSKGSSERLLSA